jgi:hypothetical protein
LHKEKKRKNAYIEPERTGDSTCHLRDRKAVYKYRMKQPLIPMKGIVQHTEYRRQDIRQM